MDAGSTRPLGRDGAMPVLGLGTWELTRNTAATVLHAIELGYRMIDTACDYGSEAGIRDALRDAGVARERLHLVDKVEEDEDAYAATRARLDALGLDRLDLVLLHRPPPSGAGEALWEGLLRARADGLASEVGVSNYSREQMLALERASGELPVVNQIEWTPFGHDDGMLAFCRERGVVLQAYSPLTRAHRLDDPGLAAVAARVQRTPAQVLLRWNLQLGTVPLPKANQASHLAENIAVFDFELGEDEMASLSALNAGWSALGGLPYR